jgi:hypothetical protein
MSQKTTTTSIQTFDPLFKHVEYCCLAKEERSNIATNLVTELSMSMSHAKLFSPCIFTAKTWEAMLNLVPQGETRNQCYTRLLDCGVSFSDGTDGIEWGAANGLFYHNVPATRILASRRSLAYCGLQLARFREHITEKKFNPSKISEFWNHLQRQLTLIVNSNYAIKNVSPSFKGRAAVSNVPIMQQN